MVCLGHLTPIQAGLLTHFLENYRVAIRVFYAEELKPVWCHFRTLSLQTSVREFLICKIYIGATDVKHSILGPLLWRLHRALIRVILSVQHDLGSPKPQPHPMRKPALRRLDLRRGGDTKYTPPPTPRGRGPPPALYIM